MSTRHVSVREFQRERKGSMQDHQALQQAVLNWLELAGIPAIPLHTGPRVAPRRDGSGFRLIGNPAQHGMADIQACLPPMGRLALIGLKSGGARRSAPQVKLHDRFARAGALTLVIRDLRGLESALGSFARWAGTPTQLQGGRT